MSECYSISANYGAAQKPVHAPVSEIAGAVP